jgi:hypothetical protein
METIGIVNLVLSTITALTIVFAAVQIKINRKQLFLSTITKCVATFRDLRELNSESNGLEVIRKEYQDIKFTSIW